MHKPTKTEVNGEVSFFQSIPCESANDAETIAGEFNEDIAETEYGTDKIRVTVQGKSVVVAAPSEVICADVAKWMESEREAL